MKKTFKNSFSFIDRYDEASRVIRKYPDRIPIICEKSQHASKDCPDIDKTKYMVPRTLTIGQFIYVIRQRLKLPSNKALFLFVGTTIPPSSKMIADVYNTYKDDDLFLYVKYSFENTFG
jgi:GABA(A) receptor-associated protein